MSKENQRLLPQPLLPLGSASAILGEGEHFLSPLKSGLALAALSVCVFCISMTEFVPAGILPEISGAFSVSIPTAALLTSVYALAVGISGPLLTAASIHLPRKPLLLALMSLFVIGSLVSAVAPDFPVLMAGRIISALCHGAFIGIGAVVATRLVAPEKSASAIALMFIGSTLANVAGVPLGTLLGQSIGWRAVFWSISALGALGLAGLSAFLPKNIEMGEPNLRRELAVFKKPKVWGALLTTAIGFSGLVTSFTYIAPFVTKVAGFDSSAVSWLVAIYGMGLVLGNICGGKAADRALMPTMYALLVGLPLALIGLTLSAEHQINYLVPIALFAIGFIGFALVSPLQKDVMNKSEGAPTLASAANISAFNFGIALGVYLAGVAIDMGYGYTAPNFVGAMLAVSALILAFVTHFPKAKQREVIVVNQVNDDEAVAINDGSPHAFYSSVESGSRAMSSEVVAASGNA